MVRQRCLKMTILLLGMFLLLSGHRGRAKSARDILRATGVDGGLIVHLGCVDG